MKIFKYLGKYWYAIIAVLLLLIVQASSDLSLPSLTSDIVDVGIQQGGLEQSTPDKVRKSTLQGIKLFMTDEEKQIIDDNYKEATQTVDGKKVDIYKLDLQKGMTKDKLAKIFNLPMLMIASTQSEKSSNTNKEINDVVTSYTAISKDAEKAQALGQEAKELGQQAQAAGKEAATATDAATAAAKGAEAQKLAAEAQTKGTQAQELGNAAKEKNAAMPEKVEAARKATKEGLGSVGEDTLKSVGIQLTLSEYKELDMNTKKIQTDYIIKTGAKMIGLTLVSAVAAIIVGLIGSLVAATVGKNLRVGQYEQTLAFSNNEMEKFSPASLITRNTNDIQQIQMGLVMIMRIVLYAPILGIGGIYRVYQTGTGMGWIVGVAVAGVLILVLTLLLTTMPKFKALQNLVDRVNLVSREIITGLPVIRAFSREKFEEKRFDTANTNLMKTQMFVNRAMSLLMPVMMLLMNGISVLIVWVGGQNMSNGQMQVGDMMAFITYTMQIVMAFMMLSMVSIILPRSNVAAARVDEVLNTEPTIKDPEKPKDDHDFKGEVKFEGVQFRYGDADADVLHHINFTAKPGETTALIGSTGSGKSTIVNLIPRLFDVTGGRITIDGIDIRQMSLHKLHELMGFVPQKGVLFSGDIASNIKFGDANISDEQMKKAAEIAQATEFINANEKGFERSISQGGTNVSGGQKQRLSIARALAKNPKILIFDDSFSALDNKTDVTLRRALSENVKDVTQIIVAQKISTILHADNIIVLDEGRVVAQGRHEELMESSAVYQEIAQSQLSNAELGIEEAD
ncbi:ABC transporter ATP-binding protein [Enterococcus dongliensis]|uniref:ABC transporter ATP-binding protein n=1 Tax=Enterococcus dongliensis TaxID=2559925 RepID=A0AAP5NMP9_9ENTE|nr:ABC transporter ATP-binding protein [Enterococcus dongliensis]MDT2596185.1 ABC transporter ATP-binding protein [Enterococcus dongliensis]MDT2603906.1 ABC transporter ATP-binding protein [Enterococcus dongliensis]MDT2634198.1 ABC transporter ATP-binding protein [Enterococcus dongliensis]MDT2637128.1 ABC transporter ATP-binding protein [Enterococcus dongliensis]MDT2642459.1 ABC transporter ATP-binding protein [Enterococcus dongliensis]